MYRIRSAAGTEAVYNSLDEFTAAVRRGEVPPEAEIFHSRANRWLDVKSHPHYRNAVNWSGPLTPEVFAQASHPPAVTPEPPRVAPSAPSVVHHAPPSRLQIAELPTPFKAASQTVSRPQLAADKPSPAGQTKPAPAEPPAAKAREIPLIEMGPVTQAPRQNVTMIEVRKPPTASIPPVSKPAAPAAEADFLVMDTGLERPIRNSNGHRMPGDDLDLLFDTPLIQAPIPIPAAVAVSPTQKPAPVTPKPQPSIKPVEPAKLPTPKAVEAKRVPPAPAFTPLDEDLEIPGPPLLESPLANLTVGTDQSAHAARGSVGLVLGSGAAAMLTAGALLVWRPWGGHSHADAQGGAAAHAEASSPSAPAAPLAEREFARAAPPPTVPVKPAEGITHPDTTRASDTDGIVAATKPSFQTDVAVSTADLGLGGPAGGSTSTGAVAPAELARHLEAAERQAHQELAGAIGGFHDVLSISRLGSTEGVSAARADWNRGATAIRQYRGRIARLEQAYEDSVLSSQRAQRWSSEEMRDWASRQSLAEPSETSQLMDLMISQVNEGLDILASLDGQYEIRDGRIRFRNPSSGTRYLSIRTWIDQRSQSWAGTPEGARPPTVNAILKALGEGFPPVE